MLLSHGQRELLARSTCSRSSTIPPLLNPTHTPVLHTRTRYGVHVRPLQHCVRAQAEATTATTTASTEAPPQAQQPKDYFAADRRPIILYDGVCNLCNGAVNIMLDLDPEGSRFRMAALQSPAGKTLLQRCGRHPEDISSIVLVEPDYRHHIRSDAILKIASGLSNPFPLLAFFGFPVPPFIRDAIYDQVANNRYSFFGKTDSCRLSNAGQEHRFVME